MSALTQPLAASGKIISAVCHGPAGLVLAKGADGSPLVKGKKVTGFTNSEEEAVGKTKVGLRAQGRGTGTVQCGAGWVQRLWVELLGPQAGAR